MKLVTLSLFVISYFFFIWKKEYRWQVSWIVSLLLILLGAVNFSDILTFIDWNVLSIFLGTLILAELFSLSGVPGYLADEVVRRTKYGDWAIISICLLAGAISTFMENVAVVLIIAPIALEISRRLDIDPVPFLICVAISSNLEGAATLVGDPPSIILAGFAKMGFNDFFFVESKPSIFFAIQVGAIASVAVLYLVFRRYRKPVVLEGKGKVSSWVPTIFLVLMIVGLVVGSFLDKSGSRKTFSLSACVCLAVAVVALVWRGAKELTESGQGVFRTLVTDIKRLDWQTFLFLIGIFVIVGSLDKVGVINEFSNFFLEFIRGSKLLAYVAVVVASVFLSAFVDNVPYVLTMLPVVGRVAQDMNVNQYLLYFGLLVGASVGGNITPLGASANVVACGILKKNKHDVSFMKFVRIGLPYTVVCVLASSVFLWLVWK